MSGWAALGWWLAFACFGVGLIIAALSGWFDGSGDARSLTLLFAMIMCAFAMMFTSLEAAKYMSSLTLITIAGRLPYVVSQRASWIATICMALVVIIHYAFYGGWPVVLSGGGAVTAGLVFIVNYSINDLNEREAQAALLVLNAELLATRELLAEHSREAERMRISRDLHDTLGHHLTALSIQLDVAARRSEGPAAEHIREAHSITRLLLSDVRDVVAQLRSTESVEFAEQISQLTHGIDELCVHLTMPHGFAIGDPAKADVLLRSVQEVITNARRHAAARNLWIDIAATASGLVLHARDDGRGAEQINWGHGLTGMSERFTQYGGQVEITTSSSEGFAVRAYLPDSKVTP